MLENISSFNGVLDEVSVSHGVVGHVVLDCETMDSVDRDCSVEGVMYCVTLDVALPNKAHRVKMYRVSSKYEALPDISKLCIFDPGH